MLVLKTTSPKISPSAPKARPVNTVPSDRASFAGRLGLLMVASLLANALMKLKDSRRVGPAQRWPTTITENWWAGATLVPPYADCRLHLQI